MPGMFFIVKMQIMSKNNICYKYVLIRIYGYFLSDVYLHDTYYGDDLLIC